MNIKTTNKLRSYQIFFLALGIFCVAAIATNLAVRRVPVHDATIESDLNSISGAIDSYATAHQALPPSLNQLEGLSSATQKRLTSYEYTASNLGSYQLCATFLAAGKGISQPYGSPARPGSSPDTSRHSKGRQCFNYQISSGGPIIVPRPIVR